MRVLQRDTGHLFRGPVTFTSIIERLAVELSTYYKEFELSRQGFENQTFHMQDKWSSFLFPICIIDSSKKPNQECTVVECIIYIYRDFYYQRGCEQN